MRVLGVIPARMASRRLPGKPLLSLRGRPLLEHVWSAASEIPSITRLVVATDSREIVAAARGFGAEVLETGSQHRTGSDRAAEALEQVGESFDAVVNLQGDEPLLPATAVDQAIQSLVTEPDADMITLACRDRDRARFENRDVVKIVTDLRDHALYFSRAPIGEPRGEADSDWSFLRHIGVYVFRTEALRAFAKWNQTDLEEAEHLEQLRALEHGLKIHVILTSYQSHSVDSMEDLEALERDWDRLTSTRSEAKITNVGGTP